MPEREFRELDDDHRVAFQEIVDYAFDVTRGPTAYDGPGDTPSMLGREFGVFEDGDLRSVCSHLDLTACVRDDWLPTVGLASVATPPEHRRRGLVGHLVDASLERWRGEYPIAALWPMAHAYYRQFGWALANKSVRYTCAPEALAFARDATSENARLLDPDDWQRLQDVHEAHGAALGLTLRRDETWWRRRVFRSLGGGKRYVYGLEGDGGDNEMDGYLVYTAERDGDDTRLRVNDLAYRDHESYLALLGLLADHDSQVEAVELYRPEESSLFDLVEDPEAVDCTVTPGPQVRVVDVEDALSRVSYPDGAGGRVLLTVTDEHAPWNDGTFDLRVEDGVGECQRVESASDQVLEATVNVNTLSQLFVGYHAPADARRLAGLEASDEAVAELASLFPPRTVYLREYF